MTEGRKAQLENQGWHFGTFDEMLDLTDEEYLFLTSLDPDGKPTIIVSKADYDQIVADILSPPKPDQRLIEAYRRYKEKTT